MTLQPQNDFSIPEETMRVARAAYPKGHLYMKIRDALGTVYQDQAFAHLFPHNGRPVEAPWRLALITIIQFIEDLPDRQAADAVRGRIEVKYLLGLELTDPGFDATVLCEFRKRLVEGEAEQLLLDAMLALFKERGWLQPRERQRTDSTHVLAKVRAINRLMCVGEAMRFALNSLAVVAGDWLLDHSDPEWLDRYGHRIEEARLPRSQTERQALAEVIGGDGSTLLHRLLPSCVRFQQSRCCAASGCKITSGWRGTSIGEVRRICRLLPSSSLPHMIKKPATVKSARRAGPATKSI
jgi:transposase